MTLMADEEYLGGEKMLSASYSKVLASSKEIRVYSLVQLRPISAALRFTPDQTAGTSRVSGRHTTCSRSRAMDG